MLLDDIVRLLQLHTNTLPEGYVNVLEYANVVGNGIVDDTLEFQKVLDYCSDNNKTVYLPPNINVRVTGPLFMWGQANLVGAPTSQVSIHTTSPYVFNFGLRRQLELAPVWSGRVEGVTFTALSGNGRILFFWRTQNSTITKNTFHLGSTMLGPMSSGNNNAWMLNGDLNGVRQGLLVTYNHIDGTGTIHGSEGMGLNQWNGAEIAYNVVDGVADDVVGIHFCQNIQVHHNELASTDGRLFVAQSTDCHIHDNVVKRMPSKSDGQFYPGIALVYIGHENNVSNNHPGPTNIVVEDNLLIYPQGQVDAGSAIYLYGPRNVTVRRNLVQNNSLSGTVTGLHILPFIYSPGVFWNDPTGIDLDGVARVYGCTLEDNDVAAGRYSMTVKQTAPLGIYHVGPVTFTRNRAKSFSHLNNPTLVENTTRN